MVVTLEPFEEMMETFKQADELIVTCNNIPHRLRSILSGRTPVKNGRDLRLEEHRYPQILSLRGRMAERETFRDSDEERTRNSPVRHPPRAFQKTGIRY
jgi:hypothetical protein